MPNVNLGSILFEVAIVDRNRGASQLKDLERQAERTADAFTRAGIGIQRFGINMQMVAKDLVLQWSLAFGVIGYQIEKTAIEFDAKMTEVRRTSELSRGEIDALGKSFLQLSANMPTKNAAATLADIAAVAGQVGLKGKQEIETFTLAVNKLSTVFEALDPKDTAERMAQIVFAFGQPIEKVERMGSVISAVANASVATASQLIVFTQAVAGTAKSLGLSFDQIVALGGVLVNLGVPAAQAGTAFTNFFVKAQTEATQFADVMGISTAEFRRNVETDAAGALLTWLNALGKMSNSDAIAAIQDLGIRGAKAENAITKLRQEGIEPFIKMMALAGREMATGASLTEQWAVKQQSMQSAMNVMTNSANALFIELGTNLFPVVKALFDAMTAGASVIESLPGPLKNFGLSLILVTAAAGPLALVFGNSLSLVGKLVTAIRSASDAVRAEAVAHAEAANVEAIAAAKETAATAQAKARTIELAVMRATAAVNRAREAEAAAMAEIQAELKVATARKAILTERIAVLQASLAVEAATRSAAIVAAERTLLAEAEAEMVGVAAKEAAIRAEIEKIAVDNQATGAATRLAIATAALTKQQQALAIAQVEVAATATAVAGAESAAAVAQTGFFASMGAGNVALLSVIAGIAVLTTVVTLFADNSKNAAESQANLTKALREELQAGIDSSKSIASLGERVHQLAKEETDASISIERKAALYAEINRVIPGLVNTTTTLAEAIKLVGERANGARGRIEEYTKSLGELDIKEISVAIRKVEGEISDAQKDIADNVGQGAPLVMLGAIDGEGLLKQYRDVITSVTSLIAKGETASEIKIRPGIELQPGAKERIDELIVDLDRRLLSAFTNLKDAPAPLLAFRDALSAISTKSGVIAKLGADLAALKKQFEGVAQSAKTTGENRAMIEEINVVRAAIKTVEADLARMRERAGNKSSISVDVKVKSDELDALQKKLSGLEGEAKKRGILSAPYNPMAEDAALKKLQDEHATLQGYLDSEKGKLKIRVDKGEITPGQASSILSKIQIAPDQATENFKAGVPALDSYTKATAAVDAQLVKMISHFREIGKFDSGKFYELLQQRTALQAQAMRGANEGFSGKSKGATAEEQGLRDQLDLLRNVIELEKIAAKKANPDLSGEDALLEAISKTTLAKQYETNAVKAGTNVLDAARAAAQRLATYYYGLAAATKNEADQAKYLAAGLAVEVAMKRELESTGGTTTVDQLQASIALLKYREQDYELLLKVASLNGDTDGFLKTHAKDLQEIVDLRKDVVAEITKEVKFLAQVNDISEITVSLMKDLREYMDPADFAKMEGMLKLLSSIGRGQSKIQKNTFGQNFKDEIDEMWDSSKVILRMMDTAFDNFGKSISDMIWDSTVSIKGAFDAIGRAWTSLIFDMLAKKALLGVLDLLGLGNFFGIAKSVAGGGLPTGSGSPVPTGSGGVGLPRASIGDFPEMNSGSLAKMMALAMPDIETPKFATIPNYNISVPRPKVNVNNQPPAVNVVLQGTLSGQKFLRREDPKYRHWQESRRV
jgi:TP901 family phage tail tape measure protein